VADTRDAGPRFDARHRGKQQLAAILVAPPRANTRVGCGHEYTLSMIRPCLAAELGHPDSTPSTAQRDAPRVFSPPHLPSQRASERRIHPLLRSREAFVLRTVRRRVGRVAAAHHAQACAAPRQWKHDF
jgi:hydroxyacylglutathione hydrolase